MVFGLCLVNRKEDRKSIEYPVFAGPFYEAVRYRKKRLQQRHDTGST